MLTFLILPTRSGRIEKRPSCFGDYIMTSSDSTNYYKLNFFPDFLMMYAGTSF